VRGASQYTRGTQLPRAASERVHRLKGTVEADSELDAYEQLASLDEDGLFYHLEGDLDQYEVSLYGLDQSIAKQASQVISNLWSLPAVDLKTDLGSHRLKDGTRAQVKQEYLSSGFGADDYETPDGLPVRLTASVDASPAAELTAYLGEGNRIHFIETDQSMQRKGLATILLDLFEKEHNTWQTNDYSAEGEQFIASRSVAK
jgi:hypothetical protein